jgi:NDP-sugar pyrophosphorylase family protein
MVQNKNILDETDVIILCGGLGTRLRSVISDQPKTLAKIGDATFLDILIGNISYYGPKNIILCVGHLKDHIRRHFDYDYSSRHDYSNRHDYSRDNYNIIFSEEEKPLGTGGALKNAEQLIKSYSFIVMNGDSICNVDLGEFLNFHIYNSSVLSMVLTESEEPQNFGSVVLDNSRRIVSYQEKVDNKNDKLKLIKTTNGNKHLVNAGIYCMQKDIFSCMPDDDQFSLEYDLFPELVKRTNNKCFGFVINDKLIDIGTPERYKNATNILCNKRTI